jgi:cellulose synthase operon protein YhjQ
MPLIAFVSPKGGVGKTTLAANVSAVLAAQGHEVLAMDLDPQNALRLHLGLPLHEESGYLTSLPDGADWRAALRPTRARVALLAHGTTDPKSALDLARLLLDRPDSLANPVREMLAEAPRRVVVLDAPPGPTPALSALLPLADLICVVLLADSGSAAIIPSIASGRFLGRGTLASRSAAKAMLILNQVELGAPLSDAVLDFAQQQMGDHRPVAAVARDPAVAEALADRRLPVEGTGPGSEDMALLAETIARRLNLEGPAPADVPRRSFSALSAWGHRQ